jgi:shikimate kinase
MVQLVGPGGAGKSTTGALLADRLEVTFFDLDRRSLARLAAPQ